MHLTGDSGIFVVKEAEEASLAFVHCVLTLKVFCRKVLILAKIARIVFFCFVLQTCHEENSNNESRAKHPLSANANRSLLIAAVSDQSLIIFCIHFDFFIKYPCLKLAIMAFLLRRMTSTNFAWKRGLSFGFLRSVELLF